MVFNNHADSRAQLGGDLFFESNLLLEKNNRKE
jgi:hypothetical protein